MPAELRALSRKAAIQCLREAVIQLTEECSRCQRATDHGIYCLGFRRFSEDELARRYARLVNDPGMTPQEVRSLENRWRVALEFLERVSAYCETHRREPSRCVGWDGFPDDELQRFCFEILREPVRIVGGD